MTYTENKWDLLQRDSYKFFESVYTDYSTVYMIVAGTPKKILIIAAIGKIWRFAQRICQ